LQDLLGTGYTLLRLDGRAADTAPLERAFRAYGAPLDVLEVGSEAAQVVYRRDLLLVRPDLHAVWRGNEAPEDPGRLAAMATGN
jgi:aromatic ring hydroxylase-like protein